MDLPVLFSMFLDKKKATGNNKDRDMPLFSRQSEEGKKRQQEKEMLVRNG